MHSLIHCRPTTWLKLKHQWGRPAGTTGWWGIKCIWHNRVVDGVHALIVNFLGALISKDATMASAHTTVQEQGHVISHNSFGCDRKQFYMFIVYLVHQVYCIHCGTTAEKGTSEEGYQWGVCITAAKSTWWSVLFLQLREFTPLWGNCKVTC